MLLTKSGTVIALVFGKGEKANLSKSERNDLSKFTGLLLSQYGGKNEFASAFGISVSTLRHWERGDRTPQGPALVLLNVVSKEPQVVLNALRA